MNLERGNMPDCPRCGCSLSTIIDAGKRLGRAYVKFGCTWCGKQFSYGATPPPDAPPPEPEEKTATYIRVRVVCPDCGAENPPTLCKKRTRRYHECKKCGSRFYSQEE